MCLFCNYDRNKIILETDDFFIIWDNDPIQDGHLLIVTQNHYPTLSQVPDKVLLTITLMLKNITKILENRLSYYGSSIMQNNGQVMDIKHVHFHIFPRYLDDNFSINDSTSLTKISSPIRELIIKDIRNSNYIKK